MGDASTEVEDLEVETRLKKLRRRLAQLRLQRMEVQRKQWRVDELRGKWMQLHRGADGPATDDDELEPFDAHGVANPPVDPVSRR